MRNLIVGYPFDAKQGMFERSEIRSTRWAWERPEIRGFDQSSGLLDLNAFLMVAVVRGSSSLIRDYLFWYGTESCRRGESGHSADDLRKQV